MYFVSLGCPKNRVDTEVMLGMSEQTGYTLADTPDTAEVIVVNTCGFIGAAKEESVDTILDMARYKESGACKRLVVTGCLSQRYPDELAREIPEIDHILGSGEVEKVVAALAAQSDNDGSGHGDGPRIDVAPVPAYLYDHTTPRVASQGGYLSYVKIAEGCDRPCGFCIIPKLRGPQRSRAMDSIASEVAELSRRGVVEVNLVAQDLTTYGTDLLSDGAQRSSAPSLGVDVPTAQRPNLANLLRRIGSPTRSSLSSAAAASADSLRWIRLHYAYPTAVTDDLLDAIAEQPLVVKYLDVPLQHADDGVLKKMRRGHVGKTVWQLVERARARVPGITLRTTFIVGHPGETEQAFDRLCDFVRQSGFDNVGVFTYSPEEGTHSATLSDTVPEKEAERRRRELMRIQRGIAKKRQKARVGQHLEVLVEGRSDESEYLLQGRHAGQAREIDGSVYLSLSEELAETQLHPGDVVRATVRSFADYDLAAEVTEVVQQVRQPARQAPRQPVKLPMVR